MGTAPWCRSCHVRLRRAQTDDLDTLSPGAMQESVKERKLFSEGRDYWHFLRQPYSHLVGSIFPRRIALFTKPDMSFLPLVDVMFVHGVFESSPLASEMRSVVRAEWSGSYGRWSCAWSLTQTSSPVRVGLHSLPVSPFLSCRQTVLPSTCSRACDRMHDFPASRRRRADVASLASPVILSTIRALVIDIWQGFTYGCTTTRFRQGFPSDHTPPARWGR